MAAVHGIGPLPQALPGTGPRASSGPGFADTLRAFVESTSGVDAQAQAQVGRFVAAGPGELHETAIAASKAEIAFRLLMSVRNRLLESYREVMRMGM
jgi:flagellar hook-basal body complex protein FliE